MKIAIIGAGKMGSLVGAFAARSGADVCLIDVWKEHVDEINRNGLTIYNNDEAPFNVRCRAFTSADQIHEKMDMVIILVMGMYTDAAVSAAMNLFDEHTYCLTLQNGMGNVEVLENYFPAERILYGILPYGGSVMGPGQIRTLVNPTAEAHFGSAVLEEPNEFMEQFATLMRTYGLNFYADRKSKLDSEVWAKMAKNASSNGVCGLVRLPLGPFNDCEDGMIVKQALYDEAKAVAAAKGIQLAEFHGDQLKIVKGHKMYDHISSSAQDVRDKKKTEIDFINGYISREGQRLGVPTPYNTIITQLVHIVEQNYDKQF